MDLLELTKLDLHLQLEIQDAVDRGDWDGYEAQLEQWRGTDLALEVRQNSECRG